LQVNDRPAPASGSERVSINWPLAEVLLIVNISEIAIERPSLSPEQVTVKLQPDPDGVQFTPASASSMTFVGFWFATTVVVLSWIV